MSLFEFDFSRKGEMVVTMMKEIHAMFSIAFDLVAKHLLSYLT